MGIATTTALIIKGSRDPSNNTLIARRGIHPITAVFLIIKARVMKAVSHTVPIVNLLF
jgi:hypothetical protein